MTGRTAMSNGANAAVIRAARFMHFLHLALF